jgi:hypothetical protein
MPLKCPSSSLSSGRRKKTHMKVLDATTIDTSVPNSRITRSFTLRHLASGCKGQRQSKVLASHDEEDDQERFLDIPATDNGMVETDTTAWEVDGIEDHAGVSTQTTPQQQQSTSKKQSKTAVVSRMSAI